MKLSKHTSLKDMLEQLTTEQLDNMLNEELQTKKIDVNAVRMIFDVLREREKNSEFLFLRKSDQNMKHIGKNFGK